MNGPAIYQFGMHFDAAAGGADRYFNGLVAGLREIGSDCTAFAFSSTGESSGQNINLGRVDTPLWKRLRAIRQAGQVALARPDAILATHFALYGAALLPSLSRAKHVTHFHGPWATESAREGQKALAVAAKRMVEFSVYRSARKLIVLSTAFRDILINDYHISADRIRVVPGGVEIHRFKPCDRLLARRALGWPEQAKIIVCVRRLVRRMGLPTLIAAFANIANQHPETLLVIAGRGPIEMELRERASSSGLGERIRFTGFVPDDDLPKVYAAADFSIVPSEALEGFGLTTLESLACGTPVMVTPVGGLPETVSTLDRSLILADKDVSALAAGLSRGLTGPLPSSAECRSYVEANFAWPAIAQRVRDVYLEAAQ